PTLNFTTPNQSHTTHETNLRRKWRAAATSPVADYDLFMATTHSTDIRQLKAGMVGFGMIFDETYRPFFETVRRAPLYSLATGAFTVALTAVATRTGSRVARFLADSNPSLGMFRNFAGEDSVANLLASGVDAVCIATPDDRHFAAARAALAAGKHV